MGKRKYEDYNDKEENNKRRIVNQQNRKIRFAVREANRELKDVVPKLDNIDKCMKCGRPCTFHEAIQYILHLKNFISPLEIGIIDAIFLNLRWNEQSLVLPETDNVKKREELILLLKTKDYIVFLQRAVSTLIRNNVQWNELFGFIKYSRSKSRNRQFI